MSTRRLSGIVVTTVCITVLAFVCVAPFVVDPGPSHTNVTALFNAYQQFVNERKDQDLTLPASISIDTLVQYSFLSEEHATDFQDVELWLAITNSGLPSAWIMRARFPDESEVILLNDGSVQQCSRERALLLVGSIPTQ